MVNGYVKPGAKQQVLNCRGCVLKLGERTLIMGILNITPDSFSDGGRYYSVEAAVNQAYRMVEEGADIIDIGAESTRPGHVPVPVVEELRRLEPVLEKLSGSLPVPISVDTTKAVVARRALEAGASLINDIWGLKADPELANTVASYGNTPLILMHNQQGTVYQQLMGDIVRSLSRSIDCALAAGLAWENIIIDPGIGFGKDTAQNLEVLNRLDELTCLARPILLGTSRKSVIGNTLGLPVTERLEGTAASVALGIAKGAAIVRIHDVQAIVRVARMTDAILRAV